MQIARLSTRPVRAVPAPNTEFGAMRPGGAGAPPAVDVVAQAHVRFRQNFGMTGLLDVAAGARISQHYTLDDALDAARIEAVRRGGAIGVLAASRPGSFFELRALELPDLHAVPEGPTPGVDPDWSTITRAPLRLGAAPGGGTLPREVLGLVGIDQPGQQRLVHVVDPG